jgi:hypothetical protein
MTARRLTGAVVVSVSGIGKALMVGWVGGIVDGGWWVVECSRGLLMVLVVLVVVVGFVGGGVLYWLGGGMSEALADPGFDVAGVGGFCAESAWDEVLMAVVLVLSKVYVSSVGVCLITSRTGMPKEAEPWECRDQDFVDVLRW